MSSSSLELVLSPRPNEWKFVEQTFFVLPVSPSLVLLLFSRSPPVLYAPAALLVLFFAYALCFSCPCVSVLSAPAVRLASPLWLFQFQNVHQGNRVDTLVRFLKARDGNVSKAHKMGLPVFAIGVGLSTFDKASIPTIT
ncbi:hypothetical protein EJ110_NYTH49970 [Nymphaea thermarum]|nr:hypothetical protein EJ110_NYTH49970 [Nymphaea thermarum]